MSAWNDRARMREHHEPEEGDRPIPKAVFALIGALFLWGIYYMVAHTGYPLMGGDARTAVMAAGGGADVSGAAVFSANCSACHQANGQGLGASFPSLAGSRWVETPAHELPTAVVLAGMNGEIEVKGQAYSGVMPAFGEQLGDAQVAAVVSYIRTAWGNTAGEISEQDVAALRERIGARGPWQGADELTATFGRP